MTPSPHPKKSTTVRTEGLGPPGLRLTMGALGRVAPPLAARWAAHLFLRTRRFRADAREHEALAGARARTLQGPAGPLAAWEWGEGPTVALVHGWEGRGSQLGGFAAPLVTAGYRVVTFDAPGHGDSPGSRSSLVAIARGLEQVTDAVGPLAGVFAHSAGAVATTWALSRGLPAERAVFIAPGSNLQAYARLFARFLGLSPRVGRLAQALVEREIGVRWEEIEPLGLAPTMEVPLLVLADTEDRQTPSTDARALARAWPGARIQITRGLGHYRILWAEETVRAAMEHLATPASEWPGTLAEHCAAERA